MGLGDDVACAGANLGKDCAYAAVLRSPLAFTQLLIDLESSLNAATFSFAANPQATHPRHSHVHDADRGLRRPNEAAQV